MQKPPRIAVLGGTGNEGRGLAQRFAHAGLPVVVGSRDPARAKDVVESWGTRGHGITVADNGTAIAEADITVVSVPFHSIAGLLQEHQRRFRAGALVIDVTVPVTFAGRQVRLIDVPEGSAAEHVRGRLPADVLVAATFKTIPAHFLGAVDKPLDCDEFVCGDCDEARSRADALVRRLPGLRPIDVGPLERARSLEHLTLLAIAINRQHKIQDARFRVVGL